MTKIIIETNEASQLAQDGGKFVFKKEAEDSIIQLLELRDFIDKQINQVKQAIADAGTQISPTFRGVLGERVRAIYRMFGERYSYEPEMKEVLLSQDFLKESRSYKVNGIAVDKHVKETGIIPDGIIVKDRSPVISLIQTKHEEAPFELQSAELLDAGEA